MAPPTTTRDFAKRPKAKVGKRAPSKLNSTDTSFKTASVSVRSQGQSLDKNKQHPQGKHHHDAASAAARRMELASSRGNALSTLQQSLRHHAPAVRASGLKGIRDAVQSLSSIGGDDKSDSALGTSILEANLPSLLPNMCRCWLDEDDTVRSLSIQLFGDILKNLSSSVEQGDLKCLVPFVPFLCAYTSSALNSLDCDIRKDGAVIVGMLASSDASPSFASLSSSADKEGGVGSNMSAMSLEMGKHVDLFIPSLERLLSSLSLGGRGRGGAGSGNNAASSSKDGTKKRKRDGNNTGGTTQQPTSTSKGTSSSSSTLLSLALLLKASLLSQSSDSSSKENAATTKQRRLEPSLIVSGECTFVRGGSAKANALLLFRDSSGARRDQGKIRTIADLPSVPLPDDELVDGMENIHADGESDVVLQPIKAETDTTKLQKIQRLTSLLDTLRMKFVELTHVGRKSDNDKDGLVMSTSELETVDILVQSMRFVHSLCQSYQTLEDQLQMLKWGDAAKNTTVAKRQKRGKKRSKTEEVQDMGECLAAYQAIVTKSLSFLLEIFPITPMDYSSVSLSRYELTNAGICSALAELGGDNNLLNDESSSSAQQWIDAVFSYISPRLKSTSETAGDDDVVDSTAEKKKQGVPSEGIATNMLLKVVSKLLLPQASGGSTRNNFLLNNPLKRHELLESFAGTFFPRLSFPSTFNNKDENIESLIYNTSNDRSAGIEQQIGQRASVAMGKTAAMLLTTLVTQSASGLLDMPNNADERKLHEKKSILLLQMTSVLPVYLTSWEGNFPVKTGLVLSSLMALVRQWSGSSEDEEGSTSTAKRALKDLCLGLRSSLEVLYFSSKKKPSIFERLPEQVQKMCVGLIGLLKSPSASLAKSLSNICSKSFATSTNTLNDSVEEMSIVSKTMATYIMGVMHLSRKTMPMPVYLTFLIDSCGIKSAGKQQPKNSAGQDGTDTLSERVFFYDGAIAQLSRFLTTSCDQASTKVLPMILPILQKWMSVTSSDSSTADTTKQIIQARAAISLIAAFTLDEVLSDNDTMQSNSDTEPPKYLILDEKFDKLLITCIIEQFDLSARLWSMGDGGGSHYMDDPVAQQQYLARLLGPITLLLRYRSGMFGQFVDSISRRVVERRQTNKEEDNSQEKINVAEVYMKVLLLVLKSKDPISIVDLVRGDNALQGTLLSAMEDIEKSVSGGHLTHLGSKLVHQAKLYNQ